MDKGGAGKGSGRRWYSPEFKAEAVREVLDGPRPVSRVSVEIAVDEGTLRRWHMWRWISPTMSRRSSSSPVHASWTNQIEIFHHLPETCLEYLAKPGRWKFGWRERNQEVLPCHQLRLLSLKDPELAVEEVIRLAAGPYTSDAALRDARMPTTDLQNALLDRSKARAAAGNPALPDSVMHALLDLAAVPHDTGGQLTFAEP